MSEQSNEPYAKYKESRRNWLGEIPAHWSAFALKFLSSERVQDGPHETPTFVDNGIPFFSVDGIQDNELVLEGCRFISESDHERYSQKCRPATGDVLLGKAASVGKVAHVQLTEPFNVWSPLAVIRPQDERMGRYIYYALQSAYLQAQCLVQSNSNTQKNLSMRAIDNLCFPAPPVAEQTQIAKFLDYEPPKIDALIEKQQQLIASLKEKRQAVISHAVTKGLNPDAPMRDSGVEWLGEVPAHWEVVKLKHLVALPIIDGPHETPTKCDEGVPFISAEAVSSGDIDFEKMWGFISHEDHARYRKRYVSTNGDILMVKLGATTGTVAMVDTTIEFNVWVPLAVIRGNEAANSRFILNVLRSKNLINAYEVNWTYGTQQTLGLRTIENLPIPVPPKPEQEEIATELDAILPRLELLSEKAANGIELLQERRTALISAAVTGKIDVRGWTAPESEAEAEIA